MKNNWKQILTWILIVVAVVLTIPLFFKICNINIYSWVFPYIEKIRDHNEFLGTYGDFFGGVIGTVLTFVSVLILAKTFEQQERVTKANLKQQDIQRFNDMFFELLRVYQEQVKELCIKGEDGKEYCGKEFFNKKQEEIQKEIVKGNENIKLLDWYMPFYLENRSKLAPYFRTLYRMFEVLENNEKLLGDKSKEYAKIIRAQLSESELFFIRANVHSKYGNNFVDYINKYRILKHLPFCDLPEYQGAWWWNLGLKEGILEELKEGINLTYLTIYEATENKFEGSDELPKLFEASKRYKFTFNLNKEKTKFKIKLEINKNIERDYREFKWIEKCPSNEHIKNILDNFLREIFFFSNFRKLNELDILDLKIDIDIETVTIISGIENKNGQPLRIKYDHN